MYKKCLRWLKEFKSKIDRKSLLIGIAVLAVIITGVLLFINKSGKNFSLFGKSDQKIADEAMAYINSTLLGGQTTAKLLSVSEESGVIKIKIEVNSSQYDSYITKDGKLLFPEAYPLVTEIAENKGSSDNTKTAETATCDTVSKSDKPALEAFVVSACPYGLQMQRVLGDIAANASDLTENFKVRYIGAVSGNTITSMHGDAEAKENLKQICIREEQSNKYWSYVSCYMKAGDSSGCLNSSGVDQSKMNSCMSDASRGVAYAKVDFDLSDKYGVEGSPTLILNGNKMAESDFGGRTSEAVKSLLCCGFNSKPGSCSKTLNKTEAATSFSESYASSGSSNNSASCGQ